MQALGQEGCAVEFSSHGFSSSFGKMLLSLFLFLIPSPIKDLEGLQITQLQISFFAHVHICSFIRKIDLEPTTGQVLSLIFSGQGNYHELAVGKFCCIFVLFSTFICNKQVERLTHGHILKYNILTANLCFGLLPPKSPSDSDTCHR